MASDQPLLTMALIGSDPFSDGDLRAAELARARQALAYLKAKLGNEAMRVLLQADLTEMAAQVHRWVAASADAWQTGLAELTVPGPGAAAFHQWCTAMLAHGREATMWAAHPEHFVSYRQSGYPTKVI